MSIICFGNDTRGSIRLKEGDSLLFHLVQTSYEAHFRPQSALSGVIKRGELKVASHFYLLFKLRMREALFQFFPQGKYNNIRGRCQ
jgi:hypothetical protein